MNAKKKLGFWYVLAAVVVCGMIVVCGLECRYVSVAG